MSAGRVQSVAVRLIVEREREIIAFKSKSFYKVVAHFLVTDKNGVKKLLKSELPKRFDNKEETLKFLESCKNAEYHIDDIVKKPSLRKPAAPFTTSTLQQEASRKLGFSVSQTMTVAQRLYEAGNITYMRTDSVNLSETALNTAKEEITRLHGADYVKIRKYNTKSKGAQEAHEAIRPTYLNKHKVEGESNEKRLYDLIWKRTIASQMSDAKLEKTNIKINISTNEEKFVATGEMIKFEGFLKVYLESTDDEEQKQEQSLLPQVNVGDKLESEFVKAVQNFTHRPPRFTEASLVKKLEDLGIGRPSTYAPTITTVQNRGYVVKESRDGVQRQYEVLNLIDDAIEEETLIQNTGAENKKLFPSDIGMVVTDFLIKHFSNIMNYNFTAEVEKEFDEIAYGNSVWHEMLAKFYFPFHENVEKTIETSERSTGERILGEDPKTGKVILVRIGRYGPMAQLGESAEGDEEKPKFASLRTGQHLETITLEEAIDLFKLPRDLGLYEDKKVVVAIGRFGPYVRHDGKFASLHKDVDDPMTIDLERAIVLVEEKREKDRLKHIKSFEEDAELQILNGRWGPYISYQKENYRLAKDLDPKSLSYEDCLKIIKDTPQKKKKQQRLRKQLQQKKKAPAKKKTTAKKATTTKKKTAVKKK